MKKIQTGKAPADLYKETVRDLYISRIARNFEFDLNK